MDICLLYSINGRMVTDRLRRVFVGWYRVFILLCYNLFVGLYCLDLLLVCGSVSPSGAGTTNPIVWA